MAYGHDIGHESAIGERYELNLLVVHGIIFRVQFAYSDDRMASISLVMSRPSLDVTE